MTTRQATAAAVDLPDSPAIPGLRFRSFDMAVDLAPLVGLLVEANVADSEDYVPSVEDFRNDLEHTPYFDAGRDILLAEIDGVLVAATQHTVRVRAGVVQHQLTGWVHPDRRRQGLGRALLDWTERRSREAAAEWPGIEPHALATWVGELQPGAIALLEGSGYERVRYGFMMVRALAEPIPDAPLPDGLEIRPVAESDHRRIWDADVEAFRDHWEPADRTEEDYVGWFSIPDLDTSLWRVAWDGDEVAGSSLNFIFPDENETLGVSRGWLEHISVRRPWRRRGLAASLIAGSLRELRARGLDEAALGVDAENLSGALRLYESLGFRRFRMGIAFRKPL